MSGKIILVTGGARSGKSTFAEKYAAASGQRVSYIATAQVYDSEMQTRVALHRERRPPNWRTYEAPYADENTITEAAAQSDIVLFDCLTLYTTNLMLAADIPASQINRQEYILRRLDGLLNAARNTNRIFIFVTNEVGLGIVPDNPLAREYRDIAGWVNQKTAAVADEVYIVISGLPVELKNIAARLGEGGFRNG